MKKRKLGILIALLILTVAFASVTTTLVLTGTLSIGADRSSFEADVVFTDNVTVLGGEYSLSNGNKTLEFKTGHLNMLESETTLSFEIRNNSRQYDANATIECSPVDQAYEEYVTVDVNPVDSFTLDALETESGTIKVKLIRSITGDASEIPFACTITAEALERDSLQKDASRFESSSNTNDIGSEVCIEEECFNIIDSTDTTLTMISKYNINKDNYRQSSLASGVPYQDRTEEIMGEYLTYLQDITRVKDTSSIQATLLTKNQLISTYGCEKELDGENEIVSCANSTNSTWLVTNQEYYLLANENDSIYESLDPNGIVVSSNNGGVRPIITIAKTLLKETN